MHKRRTLFALAGLTAAVLSLPAFADAPDVAPRAFPPNAKRGKMTPGYHPEIFIDGKSRLLAPSSRIFNQDNLIEMLAALRGKDIVVNYTEDRDGNIDRVWILTREEARQKLN
jgi:hypothetical protein